jgi:hypothetical protein
VTSLRGFPVYPCSRPSQLLSNRQRLVAESLQKAIVQDGDTIKLWEAEVKPTFSLLLDLIPPGDKVVVVLTPTLEQTIRTRCSHSTAAQTIG